MKKIFLYGLMLASTLTFWSCKDKDDDNGGDVADRLPRPMFIQTNNHGYGDDYAYNCRNNGNSALLYWYTVKDAVAYEIKWANEVYVTSGQQGWDETDQKLNRKSLAGRIVVTNVEQFQEQVHNLQYQSKFRFAIRALNSFSGTYPAFQGEAGVYDVLDADCSAWENDPKNSLWYGYGNLRQWADYLTVETAVRYTSPRVFQVSDRQKNSMRLNLNRDITTMGYEAEQIAEIREHFNFIDADKKLLKIDYLTFTASYSTPTATENPKFLRYDITDEDWANGYIVIDGLSENSVYDITIWDKDIDIPVDAWLWMDQKRTRGDAGPAILIKHVETATGTQANFNGEVTGDISEFHSMKLDEFFEDYYGDISLAENQVFYLEGGKTYHFDQNPSLYKGFTLRTNPDDLKPGGAGRARLLMAGMLEIGGGGTFCNWMLGREPRSGENPTITMDIDSVRFMDLDVDCPKAGNDGSKNEGWAHAAGNYFMNMYPNGMGINVEYLEFNNCTFQNIVRGFFRIQGSNDFYIQHFKIKDCKFYNGGNYQANGGGFNWIHADHGSKVKSNVVNDIEISGNVFYNSPHGSLFTDQNKNNQWDESVRWHLNIHHNTFVNFCTPGNTVIVNSRYVPGGSVMEFHDNVVIVTKDPSDTRRNMGSGGWDVRFIQGGDNSGACTFNIYNNWTTDDHDVWGREAIFAANPFDGTSNAPGKKDWLVSCTYPAGTAELAMHVDELKATDLMESPNPPYFIGATAAYNDFRTDKGIDGLYYKQTPEVLNSAIYQSQAGAPMLRNGK